MCVDCSTLEQEIFAPTQTLFPGMQEGRNFTIWNGYYRYQQKQFGENWCTQFYVIVVSDPLLTHTHSQKQTRSITIHCIQCLK